LRHVILTSRLDAEHGGLTASLLRKSRIVARRLGIRPVIATFHDAHDFPEVSAAIRDRYGLPPEVRLTNLNHHYRATEPPAGAPLGDAAVEQLCADLPGFEVSKTHDSAGSPYGATVTVGGKPARRFFFRPDGSVFQWRDLRAPGLPARSHEVVLDPLTVRERGFKTMDGFRRHFMDELCTAPLTYLVCEARLLDRALLGLENRAARKIFVFHSIHVRPGTNTIRQGNRALLANLDQADALVVLTPHQRADVIERFGFADRVHVIPHAIRPASKTVPHLADAPGAAPDGRTPGKVVMLARLSPEKNVAAAVQAFGTVRRSRPDAQLEVWGDGPEEPALRRLADSMELDGTVRFAGYTNNAQAVLRSAECSLLTSKWEGFPLTIMESMANGTPCIAYDTSYGPAAMIRDGVDGHLVEPGDTAALAKQIVDFLDAPAPQKQAMSDSAALRMQDFSEERLAARWNGLFDSLAKPVATQPPLVKRLWRRVPDGPRNAIGRLVGV
jgi:poly(glycerol-phosphate) alpha-glucosyltransferase